MQRTPLMSSTLALVLVAACSAQAADVTYEFAGNVTAVSDSTGRLPPAIAVGSAFVGRFQYDDSVPDQFPSAATGQYLSPGSIEVDIGGAYAFRKSAGLALIDVWVGSLFRYAKTPASGAEPLDFTGDILVDDLEVALSDFTDGDAVLSDDLAGISLDLNRFDSAYRLLYLRCVIDPSLDPHEVDDEGFPIVPAFDIRGSLTSLSVVPEPAAAALAAVAISVLWGGHSVRTAMRRPRASGSADARRRAAVAGRV